MDTPTGPAAPILRRLDALLLAILTLARIRIDSLAEAAVLPMRQADVAAHPFLGRLLSPQAMTLLAQQQLVDPIALLLIALAIGCLLAYFLVDEFARDAAPRPSACSPMRCSVGTTSVSCTSCSLRSPSRCSPRWPARASAPSCC